MNQEHSIERNIFNQLAIRGFSKAKCEHYAGEPAGEKKVAA